MANRPIEDKYPIIYLEERTYGKHCWVIRTINEEYPRYIETISQWNKQVDYSLVPNIHFAKVWCSVSPPYQAIERFEKTTGLQACFQEVPAKAYKKYESYRQYYLGLRELTEEEEKQLKLDRAEYIREHVPEEHDNEKLIIIERRK